jgi:two-component system, cell cycle sensor histidine kinase and response regulator CckA
VHTGIDGSRAGFYAAGQRETCEFVLDQDHHEARYALNNRLLQEPEKAVAKSEHKEKTLASLQPGKVSLVTQEPYKLLFEKNPRPMWVYDLKTLAFLAVNQAAIHHYGYSRDEFLHMTIRDIRPADDIPELSKNVAQAVGGFEKSGVWRHRKKEGSTIYVEVDSNDFEWDGRQARLVSATDITNRRRAEVALRESESQLAAAQAIAHVGDWSWDLVNDVITWSAEMYRIYGVSPQKFDATLASVSKLIHPEDTQRREKSISDMLAGKPFEPYAYRIIRPDGTERTVEVLAAVPELDSMGNAIRLSGVVLDITDRMRAEEKLSQLASIVESTNDAVIGKSLDGTITSWNKGAERIYGYSASEAIGKPIHILAPPENEDEIPDILEKLRRGASIQHYETVRVRKDGQRIDVSVTISLVKDSNGKIVAASTIARDITDRKRAEERFKKAFNACPEPMTISTLADGLYIDVNASFLNIIGSRREEIIGRTAADLKFWDTPGDRSRVIQMLETQGSVRDMEIRFRTKSGEQRSGLLSGEIIEVAGQRCLLAVTKDITDRKTLENQLRQAQKMEAVGQLSGGIAHDFNNLLGVILGYSEDLEEHLSGDAALHKKAAQIRKAGQRAAALTRQLLAFSRQQVLNPRALNLNEVVVDIEAMLQRLIGEDVDLKTALEPELGHAKADQGQIEQVIVNLAVNARDAMPEGGKLTIETANVDLDEFYARLHPTLIAGPYVLLAVTDTGTGIDRETQTRIFEPFFTTKELGKGTGLGLATVYGVVRQSGGHIWVYSEMGRGTTFKIYLPRVGAAARVEVKSRDRIKLTRGTGTILLVEDDEAMRTLTREVLEGSGYEVFEAESAAKALDMVREYQGTIHLLLTDVVMPGISGPELAASLAHSRQGISVIYMSGYTGHATVRRGLLESGIDILQKPFTRDTLLRRVHGVLGFDKRDAAIVK